jgi:hypothetical protein
MANGDNFLRQGVDAINRVNVSELVDKGKDILNNAQGFLDTQADFLGKSAQGVTSALFGKLKRTKNTLSKFTDGKLDINKKATTVYTKGNGKTQGPEDLDWRVSLSIPHSVKKIMDGSKTLLHPLNSTGGKLVFPYTPTVLVGHSAQWNPMQPVHTNYPFYAYENSRVDQLTITADFYVQNEQEAEYWVAAVHYLRTMTKMAYGKSANRGQPPPVVYLNGYGDFTFKNVPVIINNFQFDLKREIDYISTKLPSTADSQGVGAYAWAPTESLLTIGVTPQYSRTKQTQFNLEEYIKNGGTTGEGFI